MSTTFAASTAGISYSGVWSDGYQVSTNCRYSSFQHSTFDFTATGTDLTMGYAVGSLSSITVQVSVDGGAFSTPSLTGSTNTFTTVALFASLADSAHTVTVKISGSNVNLFYLNSASALNLTGAAPAISAHSAFSTTTIYHVADLFGLGGVDGSWGLTKNTAFSFGFTPSGIKASFQDAQLRFRSNATAIKIFTFLNSSRVRVYKDGVGVGATVQTSSGNANPTGPASNTMGWVQIVSGMDGAYHDYAIVASDATGLVIENVGADGGTIDLSTTYSRARGAIAAIGDSKTAALVGTSNDSTLGFVYKLGLLKNRPVYNGGVGSTFAMSSGTNGGTDFRYTDSAGFAALQAGSVDYFIIEIGYNDFNTSTAGVYPPTAAQFQVAYQNMLQGVRRVCGPKCIILALGYLPTTATNGAANRSTANTAVAAAVTAMADANTVYVSTDKLWGTGGSAPSAGQINAATTDGTHPTASGYDALATLLSPYISYFQSPPSPVRGRRYAGVVV